MKHRLLVQHNRYKVTNIITFFFLAFALSYCSPPMSEEKAPGENSSIKEESQEHSKESPQKEAVQEPSTPDASTPEGSQEKEQPEKASPEESDTPEAAPPEIPKEVTPEKPTRPQSKYCSQASECNGGKCSYARTCQKSCDPSQGTQNNPSCGANGFCHPLQKACFNICEPKKGRHTNPACSEKHYCFPSEKDKVAFCTPLPKPRFGQNGLGKLCNIFDAKVGGCKQGLVCVDFYCRKACRPGANGNACKSGEICVDNVQNAYTGGHCAPAGTKKHDEWCNLTDRRCANGLVCRSKKCRKACKQDGDCDAGRTCYKASPAQVSGFCHAPCDPSKGEHVNPACPVGDYCNTSKKVCFASQGAPNYRGEREAGKVCIGSNEDPPKSCDARKGIGCILSRCRKVCDPRKQDPGCASGQTCKPSKFSYLNGYCNP